SPPVRTDPAGGGHGSSPVGGRRAAALVRLARRARHPFRRYQSRDPAGGRGGTGRARGTSGARSGGHGPFPRLLQAVRISARPVRAARPPLAGALSAAGASGLQRAIRGAVRQPRPVADAPRGGQAFVPRSQGRDGTKRALVQASLTARSSSPSRSW